MHTHDYLKLIGVNELPPLTSLSDPGYDPVTLEGYLDQSAHLMSTLKFSMAGWLIAKERVTRRKLAAARSHGVKTVTSGEPFEIAAAQGRLPEYMDLCALLGVDRIECAECFTNLSASPHEIVRMAHRRGLDVQFELGRKHDGACGSGAVERLIGQGQAWLDAGALQLVVEARESAVADRFAAAFGLDVIIFEAPNKPSQFAMLEHFGRHVHLCNVRLEELLLVEIYRRGLHSDAFSSTALRPEIPVEAIATLR